MTNGSTSAPTNSPAATDGPADAHRPQFCAPAHRERLFVGLVSPDLLEVCSGLGRRCSADRRAPNSRAAASGAGSQLRQLSRAARGAALPASGTDSAAALRVAVGPPSRSWGLRHAVSRVAGLTAVVCESPEAAAAEIHGRHLPPASQSSASSRRASGTGTHTHERERT